MKKIVNNLLFNNSWDKFFLEEKQKTYFLDLINKIENEYLTKKIYPNFEKIFRCFEFNGYEKIKLVILGQDPYHIPNMADGLSFSTQLNVFPKSLQNIFKEIKRSTNIDIKNQNLENWAKQGVLLLNTILTVEENKPLSHKNIGWEIFTKNVINFLDFNNKNVIYLLMGNNAINYSSLILYSKNIIKTSHPSPFSWKKNFYGSNCFIKINEILISLGIEKIKW